MASETPVIVTSKAALKLIEMMRADDKDPEKDALRVYVQGGGCSGFQYGLMLNEENSPSDIRFESNGIKVVIDPISINYIKGAEVDFIEKSGGFAIKKNPNATSTCGCGSSFSTE